MEYEGQICRPPMERSAFMLAVAVGCAYNRCKFCNLFKHLQYRLLPLEQIEAELKRVRELGGNPRQVFLGDGNAFGMATDRLLTILALIAHYFPACHLVNMDATVTDLQRKTDAELRELKAAGVTRLYLGIEGGLDDVLRFMRKDHDLAAAEREIARLKQAGFSFNAHIMTGVAGAGRGLENAAALAAFFRRNPPERIVNFSLFLARGAPLYADILAGRFQPATELENLREARRLLELLDGEAFYDGFHDQLGLRVWGALPQDRLKLLRRLDAAVAAWVREEPRIAYAN